jgi:hypothetical protein
MFQNMLRAPAACIVFVIFNQMFQALCIMPGHIRHDMDAPVRFQVAALVREDFQSFIFLWNRFKLNHRQIT